MMTTYVPENVAGCVRLLEALSRAVGGRADEEAEGRTARRGGGGQGRRSDMRELMGD